MNKKTILPKSVIIVMISLLALRVTDVADGYFLDPTIFGFMFTPLIFVGAFLSALVFTLVTLFKPIKKKNRNRQSLTSIVICLTAWIVLATPFSLQSMDAAKYRLQTFTEKDYEAIALQIETSYKKFGKAKPYFSLDDGYKEFIEELKSKHEIFTLSSFPIDVSHHDSYSTIEWASGLTGGYEVIIFEEGNLPHWANNNEVIYIYDTVALYNKS